jgi:hypothetical protein
MKSADRAAYRRTSPLTIAFAWMFVGAPLIWGIVRTIENAAKLFR